MRPSRPPMFTVGSLTGKLPAPARPVGWLARPLIDRALKLDELSRDYDRVTAPGTPGSVALGASGVAGLTGLEALAGDRPTDLLKAGAEPNESDFDFAAATLADYGIHVRVSPKDLAKIPAKGPVIVVSNHPFGGIEGLMLLCLLKKVRPDVQLMANQLLGLIPEMREHCIFVNPFGGAKATQDNRKGMKQSMAWLKEGHLLGVFPAGEVSALRWGSRGKVQDPAWSAHVAALARKTGATVVPMHIKGANSALFHLAGLVHPLLRTVLLPREFLNKKAKRVRMLVGHGVSADRLARFGSDEKAIAHLRLRSDLLAHRLKESAAQRRRGKLSSRLKRGQTPNATIVAPTPPQDIAEELAALPTERLLVTHGRFAVYAGRAHELPNCLRELGRLREITFRKVGEGSGKAIDLDRHDTSYHHLVLFDTQDQAIAGGYRLGRYAECLPDDLATLHAQAAAGTGVYLQSLFKMHPQLLAHHGKHMLEVGRSFVQPAYQKQHAALMCLWQAICLFAAEHGDRYLVGPVSISNHYAKLSKALMVRHLQQPAHTGVWARFVRPRMAFSMRRYGRVGVMKLARQAENIQELGQFISDIEPDGKGVPVLVRQYLNWQARFLAFNVDPDFHHCLDGLIVVDLPKAPPRMIKRYMGKDKADAYVTHLLGDQQA